MKAVVICIDTRGGIQPYLALAAGLNRAGHQALVVAPKNFRAFIEAEGLAFFGIEGDVQSILQDPATAAALEKGFWAAQKVVTRSLTQAILGWTRDCLTACEGADVILGGFGGMLVGEGVAEKLGVPFVQAHVQPLTTTSEFPGVLTLRALWSAKGFVNRVSHFVSRQVFWQPMRGAVNAARREVLGLPKTAFFGRVGSLKTNADAILYGYSRHLLPRPDDWPANVHVTGYWFLGDQEAWSPPPELATFLGRGPPPIAVGFGSMSSQNAEATTRLVLEAAERSGQRVVLLSGWGGMAGERLPDSAFLVESVPHSWLFPRVALAVHHGGAGTTGAALRAGIPSVIVPFAADQPFWGRLVSSRKVGASCGSRKGLTAAKLAATITKTLANKTILERTAEVGHRVRQEDGVREAVAVLERVVTPRHRPV